MKLNMESLKDKAAWKKSGTVLPKFDIEAMRKETEKNPVWVHLGAGNIFRGFIAQIQQQLLDEGKQKTGIIAAETFDFDVIRKIYRPFDNLTMLVLLNPDGKLDKQVIGSIAEGIEADSGNAGQFGKLKCIFRNPSLQMISFTITEKGYALKNMDGNYFPVVQADLKAGPAAPHHAMSVVAAMLYERFKAGKYPLAVVSMDNCSHNGEKLKAGVSAIAKVWVENGLAEKEFYDYVNAEKEVTFPWSMIDRITPRPADEVEKTLEESGFEDMQPVITDKHTYIAPFVNTEIPHYLVIEDRFPNGRPPLEDVQGVYLTDRNTVNLSERMKVTTCLNPLHTALAVYGCLLGYTSISSEMKDPQLTELIKRIGYDEGLPVVQDPGILNPKDFIDEVIEKRLPNPFIPDTPQRIATDTSQKVGVRYGETIKSYLASQERDVKNLTYIPLAIAGWCRYLFGIDDQGKKMELSSDPMLPALQEYLKNIKIGTPEASGDAKDARDVKAALKPILSNKNIFGTDLYADGIGDKVETMFEEEIAGTGAVRSTLKKYLG
ncbi:MAG TPA: mannitol dehydrogenase family protein [Lachnospiraceae bacterium]|nr:mannitol dehydrogenase family protein [Lachnospiraceae bacterium]